jgi:hypothetical protein
MRRSEYERFKRQIARDEAQSLAALETVWQLSKTLLRVGICYHGTTKENAEQILQDGFRADSWFAAHLEDALLYGGNHVFGVKFEPPPADLWQFHFVDSIPVERIITYRIYEITTIFDRNNESDPQPPDRGETP